MKNLLIIDRTPELETKMEQFPGWSRKRDSPADTFMVLEVESPDLLTYCESQPSCSEFPHPSVSVSRMKVKLKDILGIKIRNDAATVADVLHDMGIKLD